MKRLRKFLRFSYTNQRLLVNSAFLLAMIRLGLLVFRFQTLRCLLARMTQVPVKSMVDRFSIDKVVWAVGVASRYVPATCLTQALAAQILLNRRGYSARLCIGVAKNKETQLEAHAWVESQGRVVIGGLAELSRYTPLLPLEGGRT